MSTRAPKLLLLVCLMVGLLLLAMPALAQDSTPLFQTNTPDLTPEATLPAIDPGNSPDETPEIPSGLWAIFSGYYRDAVGQFTNAIRDVSLTQFGLLLTAFSVLLIGFFKYVGPMIPSNALNILREASKDGLEVAKVELDRRHEEAKKTESPYDDAVVESLELLHGALTAIVNVTTSLAQTAAQMQGQGQPVATAAGLTPQEQLDREAFIELNKKPAPVVNIYTSTGVDPQQIAAEINAAMNPRDVARQEAEAAVAQANEALETSGSDEPEMTEVYDLDYGDARG